MSEKAQLPGTPDVVGRNLAVLFVGFNPGLRSGETGRHYAGRNNRFWDLLYESGLLPRRLAPTEDRLVLATGYGLTNLVARTTAQASELRREEYRRGAVALKRKVGLYGPRVVCYMGKGVYASLRGTASSAISFGPQPYSVFPDVIDFVAPSPSGRATIPYRDKLAIMQELAAVVKRVRAELLAAWQAGFAHNLLDHALAVRGGERVVLMSGRPSAELADVLRGPAGELGAELVAAELTPYWAGEVGDDDAVIAAPSPAEWGDEEVRRLFGARAAGDPLTGPAWRARTILLPPLPAEVLHRTLSMPYREHVSLHDRLMVTLRKASCVHVTSGCGTDLRLTVGPFVTHLFAARGPGRFMDGIPGEVRGAVAAGGASGRLVYDTAVCSGLTNEQLVLEIVDGRVTGMSRRGWASAVEADGDEALDSFLRRLGERTEREPEALAVGGLGIGTNAAARFSGCIREDETVLGACHIALGGDFRAAGSPAGHQAGGVIGRPTVRVDGKTIIADGLFVDQKLA